LPGSCFILLFGFSTAGSADISQDSPHPRGGFAVPGHRAGDHIRHIPASLPVELIPVMQAQGKDDEEGKPHCRSGPPAGKLFWRVTLPQYSLGDSCTASLLCNARAMGEFRRGFFRDLRSRPGAWTNTMPLHVEILYNEYNYVGGNSPSHRCLPCWRC